MEKRNKITKKEDTKITKRPGRPKKINQDALKQEKIVESYSEEKEQEKTTELYSEEKEQKKKENLFYYISKVISWFVMAILIIVGGLLIVYISINKIAQAKGEMSPLGLFTIISPSMTPNIQVYDVVFVKKTDPEDIQIGDIISYYSTNDYFGGIPITHRVVEKFNTNQGIAFSTKGDANPIKDEEVILPNNIVGVVKGVIPQLGRVQFFLASKAGWLIVILLPAMGILIYDVLKLVKLLKAKSDVNKVRKALAN